jgi:type IV pilus assembly protein PilF
VQEYSNAQTLWLAARIENKMGNARGARDYGRQLRARFPQAPETQAFERGRYDD